MALERGERAPDFVLPAAPSGTPLRFYGHAGGEPLVLVLRDARGGSDAAIRDLARDHARRARVFVIGGDPAPIDGATVLVDEDGAVRGRFRHGPEDGDRVLLLDARVRVSASVPLGEPIPAAATEERPAPILLVSRVLDVSTCARLIETFEREGHVETGVEESRDGRRSDELRPEAKRRRDHTVADAALLGELTRDVGRRVIPEIRLAFAYTATRFEGFKIARYDADAAGHFAPHRDNLSPSTAHRRFAMSLNLNEDYEGGELRFPEYGSALYRPGTGEALIFSGSLLHEARPVTRGRRFVLLSFLFAGEERR